MKQLDPESPRLDPESPLFMDYKNASVKANLKGHAFPATATQVSTGRSANRPEDANGLLGRCLNCGDTITVTLSADDQVPVTVAPAFECPKAKG
jgi:hypothetical protein